MPTYDYICNECGERFEHFQPMSSSPLTEYVHCKDEESSVKRLISGGSGLIFKKIFMGFKNDLFLSVTAESKFLSASKFCNLLRFGVFGEDILIVAKST